MGAYCQLQGISVRSNNGPHVYRGANKMSWRHKQAHGWPKSADDGAALASLEQRQREAEARKGNAFVRLGKASLEASTQSVHM